MTRRILAGLAASLVLLVGVHHGHTRPLPWCRDVIGVATVHECRIPAPTLELIPVDGAR